MLLLLLQATGALAQDLPPPPIYGGTASADNPGVVVLLDERDGVVCAGALLRSDLVLTAAHCTFTADLVAIDVDGEASTIVDAQRHPDWSSEAGLDAALLVIEPPLDDHPVLPLAHACEADPPTDGEVAVVSGWGASDESGTTGAGIYRVGEVTIVDADCADTAGCRPGGRELAAVGDEVDACVGDSGAPLVRDGVLIGIASRAIPEERACGDGGLYTRTDALADWIVEMVGETPEGPCPGEGCGCATGPGSGWVAWPVLWLLLRRRRP